MVITVITYLQSIGVIGVVSRGVDTGPEGRKRKTTPKEGARNSVKVRVIQHSKVANILPNCNPATARETSTLL